MPWSPTQYFPHPLASLQEAKSDPKFANYMSYTVMELLAWQGYRIWSFDSVIANFSRLGDVINGFRMKTLHLDAISPLWGHMLLSRLKVPFTYTWYALILVFALFLLNLLQVIFSYTKASGLGNAYQYNWVFFSKNRIKLPTSRRSHAFLASWATSCLYRLWLYCR
jgi:hypothetical protein